jgi:hypothetical protein
MADGFFNKHICYSKPMTHSTYTRVPYEEFLKGERDSYFISEYPWSDGSTESKGFRDFRYDNIQDDVQHDKDLFLISSCCSYERYIITAPPGIDWELFKGISLYERYLWKGSQIICRLTQRVGDCIVLVFRELEFPLFPTCHEVWYHNQVELDWPVKDTWEVCNNKDDWGFEIDHTIR